MEILYIEPKNCDAGAYDLDVVVAYQNTVPGGFNIEANGTTQLFQYTSSPQTITLFGLNTTNNTNALLRAFGTSNSGPACIASTTYEEPTSNCLITIGESFNACKLPYSWTASSTNSNVFSENFEWKFNDGTRNILNYAAGDNATTDKTINGTCAAYFDDDIFMNSNFTGTITLETKEYDLSNMSGVTIELDYNFHNFEEGKMSMNGSEFMIQIFNGSTWINVLSDDDDGSCPWFNVWQSSCITNYVLNVDSYLSSQFKVRFIYTDGNAGDWTGMIMIDDFKISGVQLSVLDLSILEFDGVLEDDKVLLNWDVERDHTFSHYTLERSKDGMSFENLAKLNEEVQFIDNDPYLGNNYYRLQVFDQDGDATTSNTIMLNSNTNQVTLINRTSEAYEELYIYTLDGKELSRFDVINQTKVELDVTNLDQGIYFVQLKNSTVSKTIRLVRI